MFMICSSCGCVVHGPHTGHSQAAGGELHSDSNIHAEYSKSYTSRGRKSTKVTQDLSALKSCTSTLEFSEGAVQAFCELNRMPGARPENGHM